MEVTAWWVMDNADCQALAGIIYCPELYLIFIFWRER